MEIQNGMPDVFRPPFGFSLRIIGNECFHVLQELLIRYATQPHLVENGIQLLVEIVGEPQQFMCLL
jgi:hypothetical protein